MHQRRPSRVETFDYLGRYRYFLTMCVHDRRTLFGDAAIVEVVRLQILRTFAEHGFEFLAYTFMPDHVHLLVCGATEASDFRRATRIMRRRTTLACPANLRPLWQDGYHERVLRGADPPDPIIDYILENPVKAGLASRADAYPFSWSVRRG